METVTISRAEYDNLLEKANIADNYLDSNVETIKLSDEEIEEIERIKSSGLCNAKEKAELMEILGLHE